MIIGVSFHLFSFDWILTGGVIIGWVTFLAAVSQILGFDLKMFLSSGDVRKRKSIETNSSTDLIALKAVTITVSKKEVDQLINDAGVIFASPLILLHTLSPISDEQPMKLSELKDILDCNIHILKSRVNELYSLGLVELIGEKVKRTLKGKLVCEYLKVRFAE